MKKKRAKKPSIAAAPIQAPHETTKPPVPAIVKHTTIYELEAMLNSEEETTIEILPNGEVRAVSPEDIAKRPKPLTMRENLGGEYAVA